MDVNDLISIGFSKPGAKIYIRLLFDDYLSVKQLSDSIDVPQQTLYREIKELEDNGLIKSRGSSPKEFFLENPELGFKKIIDSYKNNLLSLSKKADILFNDCVDLYREKFDEGFCSKRYAFFSFKHFPKGIDYLNTLIKEAQKEVIICNVPPDILVQLKDSLDFKSSSNVYLAIFLDTGYIDQMQLFPTIKIFKGDFKRKQSETRHILDDYEAIQAEICIDDERFVSIVYKNPFFLDDVIISSFYSPTIVNTTKRSYLTYIDRTPLNIEVKSDIDNKKNFVIESITQGYETKAQIMKLVSEENFSLTGSELKKIVQELQDTDKIKINIIKNEKGRPKEVLKLL